MSEFSQIQRARKRKIVTEKENKPRERKSEKKKTE